MLPRLSPTLFLGLALGGLSVNCNNGGDLSVPPSGSGGSFFVGGGQGGVVSSGGTGIAGGGMVSQCALLGGPVDIGRIGGPGRDATSNLWTLPFATGYAPHLAVDAQGALIVNMKFSTLTIGATFYTGTQGNDTLLAKFDPDGNVLWSKALVPAPYTSLQTELNALATDAEGNIYVAGSFASVVAFGGEPLTAKVGAGGSLRDAFVVKLDPQGHHIYSKQFGDANDQTASALAVDPSGNVTVAGGFGGIVNFGGEDFISARGSFGFDTFVAKFDKDGEHLLSTAFGSQRDEQVTGLALDAAGNTVVFGHNGAAADGNQFFGDGLFIRKFDAALLPVYDLEYPSNGVTAGGLAVDSQQNAVFTAAIGNVTEFEAGVTTPQGIAVVKLDSTGKTSWHKSFGDLVTSAPPIGVDADGNILLSGGFTEVDFGGGPLPSAGSTDAFVAKLDPAGDHLWSLRGGSCALDYGVGLQVGPDGSVYVAGSFVDTIAFSAKAVRGGDAALFVARFEP